MSEKKENSFVAFVKSYHTDSFKWNDFFIIPLILSFLFISVGQIIGGALTGIIINPFVNESNAAFLGIFQMYLMFIGIWLLTCLYCYITKRNRPILKAITGYCKGNTIGYLLLGLLVGFIQNAICVVAALLHKDIAIYFDSFQIVQLIVLLIAVFIQSSAEELVCRGFLYQRLRRGYRHPAVAVIGNAVLFSALHLGNPGVNALALVNIALIGLLYSLLVYYCDSIWLPMAAHAGWNYTQNIIFGLPNSGLVSDVSIFKLDVASASNSFAYNVNFGVESTIVAAVLIALCCVAVFIWGQKKNNKPTEVWD